MEDIQTGSIEFDRVTRLTKDVRSFDDACTFYLADLSTTEYGLTLYDNETNLPIEGFEPINLFPTLIESPTGSISPNPGNENKVVIEFTVPRPSGSIPENSNWFVEWEDELGQLDWHVLYISEKTSDEVQEVFIPY